MALVVVLLLLPLMAASVQPAQPACLNSPARAVPLHQGLSNTLLLGSCSNRAGSNTSIMRSSSAGSNNNSMPSSSSSRLKGALRR